MPDTYRIDGDCIDTQTLWEDVTVTDINIDGDITLESATDTTTWTVKYEQFHEWRDDNHIAKHNNMADPDHHIWPTLKTLYQEATEPPHSDSSDTIQLKAHQIFKALLYRHTQ